MESNTDGPTKLSFPCGMQVRDIGQEALVIWGANDRILDPKYMHEFEGDLRHVKTYLISECGHTAHLEQSELCAQLILEFAGLLVRENLKDSIPCSVKA
jgi:pimeloyl-ACP methyl ester carboxylesterase